MMNGPLDRKAAAALVVRTVSDIDASTPDQRDALLTDLLYAVWGSIWAQNQ
jgi:hypothetical protein